MFVFVPLSIYWPNNLVPGFLIKDFNMSRIAHCFEIRAHEDFLCFFRIDGVYIHQNDRLKKRKILTRAFFQNRSLQYFSFFETVVLMYIDSFNSKKCVTAFSWIFRFRLIDFSKKFFEFFFTNGGCPGGMWTYV